MNFDPKQLDDLARQVSANMPSALQAFSSDVEKHLRLSLSAALQKMDLITREEFDVQSAVLKRTREKLERLEPIVAQLEKDRKNTNATNTD